MKKLIRRMLASVLTVCMLLGMLPVSARAMDKPPPLPQSFFGSQQFPLKKVSSAL